MPAILNAQHLAPSAGFFEPQRQYNWSLEVALDDAGDQIIVIQSLQSFSIPKVRNDEITLDYGNEVRYVAGKARFDPLPLTVKDFVDIGSANALLKWRRQVYNAETGSVGLASQYKKNADLILGSPDGSVSRVWKLIGCWPVDFDGGNLDMSSSEKVMIGATIRYDRAVEGAGLNGGLSGINVGVLTGSL